MKAPSVLLSDNTQTQTITAENKGSFIVSRSKLEKIIRLAISGDPASQEELCRLYIKTIMFQARLLAKNHSDAEDIVQKVLIEMLRGISNLKSPFAFRSWLQQIIIHAVTKQNAITTRHNERQDLLEKAGLIIDESSDARPDELVETKEFSEQLGGYLERLPTKQALSLVLYYYEELSYKEIAQVLGVSIGSVSNTMSKAKKNLRTMLKADAKNSALLMGIVYRPTFVSPFARKIKKVVNDEVNSTINAEEAECAIGKARLAIAASALSAGLVGTAAISGAGALGTGSVAGTGTAALAGRLLANTAIATAIFAAFSSSIAAILLLTGQIGMDDSPVDTVVAPSMHFIDDLVENAPAPNISIVYSMETDLNPTDQIDGNKPPINPMHVHIEANNSEVLETWVLTDAEGNELLSGSAYEIDIRALALTSGTYTVTWYMHTQDNVTFTATWSFVQRL